MRAARHSVKRKWGSRRLRVGLWAVCGAVALLLASCQQGSKESQEGIHRVAVSSSAMRSVGYDANRNILEIEFPNRTVYRYYNVAPEVHRGLMAADSHGRYFHGHIRSAGYRYEQVE